MPDHTEAVAKWAEDDYSYSKEARDERARHLTKLNIFVRNARDSLFKHFRRWLNHSLLPAALMSEEPTAKVVAACMLGKSVPTFDSDPNVKNELRLSGKLVYNSEVHKREIDLVKLHKFISGELNRLKDVTTEDEADHGQYAPQALVAADMLLGDFDMRKKDYQSQFGNLRWHMHSTCLPLPSQTQFVESLVKDAANASQTDRSEQHRSCYCIV